MLYLEPQVVALIIFYQGIFAHGTSDTIPHLGVGIFFRDKPYMYPASQRVVWNRK